MQNVGKEEKFFSTGMSRHVLFNALNSAIVLCRRNPREASNVLGSLSQCLLYTSGKPVDELVPLSAELNFAKSYLHIQSVRFGKRLNIKYDIPEKPGFLPAFTLQPLLDNVFQHVMLRTREKVTLTIKVVRKGAETLVIVEDNQVGMEPTKLENFWDMYQGRSLHVLNTTMLKNGLPELEINSRKGKGTSITVRARVL